MRISDWSSDVCSSDLFARNGHVKKQGVMRAAFREQQERVMTRTLLSASALALMIAAPVHAQEVPADPTMPPASADPTSPGAPMPQDPPSMPADPAMPAPEAAPAGPAAPGESALPADPATPAGPAMPALEATPPDRKSTRLD